MTRVLPWVAFFTVTAFAAWPADVPRCRLEASLAAPVARAAADALRGYAAAGRALPLDGVVAAPESRPGALVVELVRDAEPAGVDASGCLRTPKAKLSQWIGDPDIVSVDGVCVVIAKDRIRCSANALTQLAAHDLAVRSASTTLLFVLAHELGHIRRGEVSQFVDTGTTLDRSAALAAKFAALDASCPVSTPAALAIEEGADGEAREAMIHVLDDPPYRESLLSPRASLLSQVFQLRTAAAGFEHWPEDSEGSSGAVQDILERVPLPGPPSAVEEAAHQIACTILPPGKGRLRLPVLRGSHPDTARRLAAIADSLEARARTLSATAPDGANQPLPPALDALTGDVSGILSQLDREYADMYPKVVGALCTLRNQWRDKGMTEEQIEAECARGKP